MQVLSKNNKVLIADGQAVKWRSGGVEPQDKTCSQANPVVAGYLTDAVYKSDTNAVITVNEEIS